MKIDLRVIPAAQEFTKIIKDFRRDMLDFRPVWNNSSVRLKEEIRKQLLSQGKLVGEPWAPLSKRYAAWKLKRYGGLPMFILSGAMRNRIRKVSSTPKSMRLGITGLPYPAAIHWGGHGTGKSKKKFRNYPRRAFMLWRAETEDYLLTTASNYTDRMIKRAFSNLGGKIGAKL